MGSSRGSSACGPASCLGCLHAATGCLTSRPSTAPISLPDGAVRVRGAHINEARAQAVRACPADHHIGQLAVHPCVQAEIVEAADLVSHVCQCSQQQVGPRLLLTTAGLQNGPAR